MQALVRNEQKLYGIALILAPLLLAIGTFFWQEGQLGLVGGTIQVYSFMFWIPAMLGLLALLRSSMPNLAVWGILLVSIVGVAGANFGMDGVYLETIAKLTGAAADPDAVHAAFMPFAVLVLFAPGLLFPLTLLLLGFFLWRRGAVTPVLALLLCLGAVGFPMSRLPRIDLLAHIADLLLLIGAAGIGLTILQGRARIGVLSAPIGAGDD